MKPSISYDIELISKSFSANFINKMMIEHQTCVCLSFSSVCKTSIELLVLSTPYPCLFLHNKVLCPRLADEERRKSVKFFVFVFCVRMWECFTYAPSIQRMIWSM